MKNTFLCSLLLVIISVGSLFSQTIQNEVQGATTQNQLTAEQELQKEIAKTNKVVVTQKANKATSKNRQLNNYKRRSCCSAHGQSADQKASARYRARTLKYKSKLKRPGSTKKKTTKNH